MISVTNLENVYMRREKLYNLSQRDLMASMEVHMGQPKVERLHLQM